MAIFNSYVKLPDGRFWMILGFEISLLRIKASKVCRKKAAYVACLPRVLGKGFMLDPRSLLKQHMFVTQCHFHPVLQILTFFVLSSVVAVH